MSDLDDLTAALQTASTGIATLGTDQAALISKLEDLEGQTNPDLSGAIAAAKAIGEGVATIDSSVKAALGTPAPPVDTPAPEADPTQ